MCTNSLFSLAISMLITSWNRNYQNYPLIQVIDEKEFVVFVLIVLQLSSNPLITDDQLTT